MLTAHGRKRLTLEKKVGIKGDRVESAVGAGKNEQTSNIRTHSLAYWRFLVLKKRGRFALITTKLESKFTMAARNCSDEVFLCLLYARFQG